MRRGMLVMCISATALLLGCDLDLPATLYPQMSQAQLVGIERGIAAVEGKVTPNPGYAVRAAIVPHHLTATETLAAGVAMLRREKPKRIVLLSPDHFSVCSEMLCTTNGVFATPSGNVLTDANAVRALLRFPSISLDPALFEREHGIFTIIPYLSYYLPGVPIVPIAVTADFRWRGRADAILNAIKGIIDDETLLLVSSDFSHYLPLREADRMDEETAKMIFAKDFSGIAHLKNPDQSDCPACLWVLARIADEHGFYNPSVIRHTNSARILNETATPSTTSHFAMVFYENAALEALDPAFGGDVTVTRRALGKPPTLTQELSAFWSGTGARIVNLEGPLGGDCLPSSNPYLFCNRTETWSAMKDLATHWGIVNNHMLDRWSEGITETERIIRSSNEMPVTTTMHVEPELRLIAVTELMNPVGDERSLDLKAQASDVWQALRQAGSGALTVVLVHGGGEYHALTSLDDEKYFESFIDAGADAVIVAHSHVVGDMFIYKGKPIFRGLGNFVFDQFDSIPTSTAKLVRLRKEKDHVSFETLIAR